MGTYLHESGVRRSGRAPLSRFSGQTKTRQKKTKGVRKWSKKRGRSGRADRFSCVEHNRDKTAKNGGRGALLEADRRIRETQGIVPVLVELSGRTLKGRQMRVVGVLAAWGDLAGIVGWDERMIEIVEEALG